MQNRIHVGDEVEVISNCQSRGQKGNVLSCDYDGYVRVDIGGYWGERTYMHESLQVLRKSSIGIEEMKGEFIMLEGTKVVGVKFITGYGDKTYSYICYEEDIKVGDTVVVDAVGTLGLAKVSKLYAEGDPFTPPTKEIVAKVDTSAWDLRKATAQRKAELKKTMDLRVKKLQNIAIYEMLAKEDPELAEMLSEFKVL